MTNSARTICHLAATFLLFAFSGCDQKPAEPPDIYHVRAQVRRVPVPDIDAVPDARSNKTGEIYVRHEAIPGFKDADGRIVGMDSMSMPFPLADVSLVAGIEAGDKIEMELEVSWHGGNPLKVTAIERLPARTRLDFGAAEAQSGAQNEPQ